MKIKKSIQYIFYFIISIVIIIILFFSLFILENRFHYLFAKFPIEANSLLGKFKIIEDNIEKKDYKHNNNYNLSMNNILGSIISIEKNSYYSTKIGICKSGYFVLNSNTIKPFCDSNKSLFCTDSKSDYNTNIPISFIEFNCSSNNNQQSYYFFILKNNFDTFIWLQYNGFYFKLQRIKD